MKIAKLLSRISGGALAMVLAMSPHAEDIDLFLGLSASAVGAPNVLFVIDNTANWSQTGTDGRPAWDSEQEALAAIFRDLEEGVVNVGFLLYTESGGGNSNTDGAYVRSAIRNMDAATKELYAQQIESFHINDDKSNGGKAGLAMAEAYLYFAGEAPEAGNGKVKTDYTGNPDGYAEDQAVWALAGNALDSKSDSPYNSPIPPTYCGKNYIIYLSNGAAQDNTSDIRRGEALLSSFGGDTTQISISPSGSAKNPSDEWARFMKQSSYDITTFTIDVNKVTTGQGPGWTALLQSMADESGGTRYDVGSSVEGITNAVNDALSKILAKNTVFASVALPASGNTQSTFLNQVYVGQFRPDADANPRWVGNVKQYKLGFDSGSTLRLMDANDVPAIDANSGFIQECAQSYWTPGSLDSYFGYLDPNDQLGNCLTVANSKPSNYPDGPIVEKGGQAYLGRGGASYASALASSRTVYTMASALCGGSAPSATCTRTNFNDANGAITDVLLGATGATERTEYINWARGADERDEYGDANAAKYRPSMHGDVIHSQPVAIDFAADPNDPRVVVFYGANDGMLRAINGNRATSHDGSTVGTGTAAGAAFWSFMPPDYYPQVERTIENSVPVRFPATAASAPAGGALKPYGPDGPITAWDNGATNRHVYFGMRRGGRTFYGLDVSDITNPQILFRLGCTTPLGDNSGCATGWDDIGDTWSPLSPVWVSGVTDPYLLMGGGYDTCEDFDDPNTPANHNCASGTDGDKIYVLNSTTGAIVASFDTERSVPGRVIVVSDPDDANPDINYAYAADTGGNVYRLSAANGAPITTETPSNWVITKIADLGCGNVADATCSANRKFLFGPDAIRLTNSSKIGLLVGTGDREKPIMDYGGANSVQNYFYTLFDDPTDADWLTDETGTCNEAAICPDSLTAVDPNGPVVSGTPISAKGWKMALRTGEQVVSAALTIADIVNFSTHIPEDPNNAQCDSEQTGTATTYNVNYADGEGILIDIVGGGLVPSPVAGKVVLDDGTLTEFCIGCGGEDSALGGKKVSSGISWSQPKSRVYWKIEK